jgi:CPA1 family monovalent cation:H+ antiporter
MLTQIAFVLAFVVVVVVVGKISHRVGLPDAALLAVAGMVYGFLPGPNIRLDPELVLDVVLPPLLYVAALGSSLLALRSRMRTVVSLSVLLVLATALAVGGLLSWLVPVIPLAAAIALGAAAAPPDPVAALSIGRRAGLPAKLTTLIEGEGLLNDATALTTFQVALVAAVGGGFSLGLAVGQFFLAAFGGLIVGILVALVVRLSRRMFTDPLSANAISLATPFAAYTLGEAVHVSGVLAVVITGLLVGYQSPKLQTGETRLQTGAVWRLINYLLEGLVFLLIGQQLPAVLAGLTHYPVSTIVLASGITVGVVLLLRPLWLYGTQQFPRWVHSRLGGESSSPEDRPLTGKEIFALSWAGTRGVITLAAAFAIPRTLADGQPFPGRDLLLFCAYVVVLVTLLGQGLTFGPLLRRLRLPVNIYDEARLRNEARVAAAEAALGRLDQLEEEEGLAEKTADDIRQVLLRRHRRYRNRLDFLEDNPDALRSPEYHAAAAARRAVIEAQHEEFLRWRDAGRLPDSSLRILQRELDHEERTLPSPPPNIA